MVGMDADGDGWMGWMRSFVGYYCLLEAADRCWLYRLPVLVHCMSVRVPVCRAFFFYNCVAEVHCGIPRAVRPPSYIKTNTPD